MDADVDVVIVGGGAAGIAAARRLATTGLSILMLEATSRLGGRAWTEHVAGMRLDLGCAWLHSADRNSWTSVAETAGVAIDRRQPPWKTQPWKAQYGNHGFGPTEQAAAKQAFAAFMRRLSTTPPASDKAADALEPGGEWNAYLRAVHSFTCGTSLETLSVADYLAYCAADTGINWRVPSGYGSLIVASFPAGVALRLETPVESIALGRDRATLNTPAGTVRARAAVLTVSITVLAGDAIRLPVALDPWREAASGLPLGRNEKLFFEILDEDAFGAETDVLGNFRESKTGRYHIRSLGRPLIECFLGGPSARLIEESGPTDGFAFALDELANLFGSAVRQKLRPLIATDWGRATYVGGAYSNALSGHAAARHALAQPFEQLIFFAGEATSANDFGTAHGAHDSGIRAAEQVIGALRSARPI